RTPTRAPNVPPKEWRIHSDCQAPPPPGRGQSPGRTMGRSEGNTRAQRLAKRAAEFGVLHGCPSCGHHQWESPRDTGLIPHRDGRGLAYEVVMVVCTNCFYIQFHSAHHLEK